MLTDALDDVFGDGGRMVEVAQEQLIQLNGWAALIDAGYRPVRLRNKFHRDREPRVEHIVVSDKGPAPATASPSSRRPQPSCGPARSGWRPATVAFPSSLRRRPARSTSRATTGKPPRAPVGGRPKQAMTLDEAQAHIRNLARAWLDSLP